MFFMSHIPTSKVTRSQRVGRPVLFLMFFLNSYFTRIANTNDPSYAKLEPPSSTSTSYTDEENLYLYCWECTVQPPCLVFNFFTREKLVPPLPPSPANMDRNNYLHSSPLTLPFSQYLPYNM